MATILIADQDYTSSAIMAACLEGEGHTVVIAMTGLEAQELALSELPDMIFLATALPIFNGFETCEMLRDDPEVPKELPIVLIASDTPDTHTLEHVGATSFFMREHLSADLRELVINLLGDKAVS